MKKKSLLILGLICALSMVALIAADVLYTVNLNMNATLAPSGSATITINGQQWTNNVDLAVDWDTIHSGDNTVPVTIYNNVNTALTPSLRANPTLPTGWTLTLTLNSQTIAANGQTTGTLTLNVPTNAAAGTYSSMKASIDVSWTPSTVTWQ